MNYNTGETVDETFTYDADGLIYMRARYYSSELRRFVNADIFAGDIANAVTLNRYAYANGNPVSMIDPLGREATRAKIQENINLFYETINQLLGVDFNLGDAEVYAGNTRYYVSFDAQYGGSVVKLDANRIVEEHMNKLESSTFSADNLSISFADGGSFGIEYSQEIEVGSISASMVYNMSGSFTLDCTVTTENASCVTMSTSIGMEVYDNGYPSAPAVATVPNISSQKESFGDKVIDAVNDVGETITYVVEETGNLINSMSPVAIVALVIIGAFVVLSPVP